MTKQIVSKAVGIDLGTTNSAVAVMNTTDTEIIIHKDPRQKRETTPSCVWKDPKSGAIVVGSKAFRRIGTAPVPIRSIKRSMGTQTTVTLTNEELTPEQVSAHILREMKQQIEADVQAFASEATEWIVDRAIVTVPAYFDQPQIDATRRAAELAGLQVVDLLHEPTAAACYHCWRTGTQNGTFLVYDFGGGTFDVSILRCTEGAFEVLGISGNKRLGGDDIDELLAEYLQERLMRDDYALELDRKHDPEDRLRFDQLKLLAEGVKKALSQANEFVLRDAASLRDKTGQWVEIDSMFERDEVEKLMLPVVERTLPYCFEALERAEKKAGMKLSDVDAIILAGGSTHIPLVRTMVKETLCADANAQEPRAKCAEPIYERVDTIVALGAAIRAAAVGGLAIYSPERTVRISFRGTGTTAASQARVAGKVEALAADIDLAGGHIRLTSADSSMDEEQELKAGGIFGFTRIPLQPEAENLLTFEVYDHRGALVATAGRSVSQSREAPRPTGGNTSTSVLAKAILMEVSRAGKTYRKELIPALETLPLSADFTFFHPGDTELLLLPLYQGTRKIQEIQVSVLSSLPRGTPIELHLHIDELSFITVEGKIGETSFECAIELPPERAIPTAEQVQDQERSFQDAVAYLPPGKKAIAGARLRKTKESFEAAARRGDREQAVHEFEEIEELVAGFSDSAGPLDPPKEFFDNLIKECYEYNQYVSQVSAVTSQPHDPDEMAKAINTQRIQGEKAFRDGDQTAYSETLVALEAIRDHLIRVIQKGLKDQDTRTDAQKIADFAKAAIKEASEIGQFAAAQGRKDLQEEIELIKQQLSELLRDVQQNPEGVREKVSRHLARLDQIKNTLMRKPKSASGGELVEEH